MIGNKMSEYIYNFTKAQLEDLYITQKKSTRTIAALFNTNKTTIKRHLKIHKIEVRNQKQFFEKVGFSETHRKNISKSRIGMVGEKCGSWKGGLTKVYQLIRGMPEAKEWRIKCFERDNYTCQHCNKRGCRLNVDHIKPLAILIRESNITGTETARDCVELWDIDNGKTLCEPCHRQTDTFAGKMKTILKEMDKIKRNL